MSLTILYMILQFKKYEWRCSLKPHLLPPMCKHELSSADFSLLLFFNWRHFLKRSIRGSCSLNGSMLIRKVQWGAFVTINNHNFTYNDNPEIDQTVHILDPFKKRRSISSFQPSATSRCLSSSSQKHSSSN